MRTTFVAIMTLALAALGCGGCQLVATGIVTAPNADELARTPYPGSAQHGEDLDIIVSRKGFDLNMVNRTAHSYGDVQIWLNQQYVGQVKRIDIGQQNHVALSDFVNAHREPYPVGGLLDPDKGFPIVLAELFDPAQGTRHRLLVHSTLPAPVIADEP